MSLLNLFLGRRAREVQPDQIEVLFHTEAAYFGEHGRLLMTNRALGIEEKPVIFCLKGISSPIPMNLRLFWHIWESAKAQGFIPLELLSYGKVIERSGAGQDDMATEHADHHPVRTAPRLAVAPNLMGAQATAPDLTDTDVPAFLRRTRDDEVGHQSAGFAAAELAARQAS